MNWILGFIQAGREGLLRVHTDSIWYPAEDQSAHNLAISRMPGVWTENESY